MAAAFTLLAGAAVAVPAAAARPAATRAVPANFRATSITWISPLHGWVLGAAPCGTTHCTWVIETLDGGRTWHRLGRINSAIGFIGDPSKPGVTEIRFATARIGFAFAPYLFRTTDGGRTWTRMTIPGAGKQVFDLEGNARSAFALVSPCTWMDFTRRCRTRLSLWQTRRPAGADWTRTAMKLPWSTHGDVAVHGKAVYVVDPQEELTGKPDRFYASTDGGRHFAARRVPCDTAPDVELAQAVATSATNVALLCVGNPGMSKAEKFVYTSTDAAKTYHYGGTMGVYGIQSQLAVSPSGNMAVASQSDGSFIYVNKTRGRTKWSMVWATSDGGAGWNDIVFTGNRTAWVVRGPLAGPGFSGRGKLYVTHDAGAHWYIHRIKWRADTASGYGQQPRQNMGLTPLPAWCGKHDFSG